MARRDLRKTIAIDDSNPRRMKRLLVRFFALLCAVSGGLTGYSGLQQVKQAQEAQAWPSVTGKIVNSEVRTIVRQKQDEKSPPTYVADVRYEFKVGDVIVRGSRIARSENTWSNEAPARTIVDRYPVGKEVLVFFQPRNFQMSLLELGTPMVAWLLCVVGAGLLLLAAVVGFWLPRYLKLSPT